MKTLSYLVFILLRLAKGDGFGEILLHRRRRRFHGLSLWSFIGFFVVLLSFSTPKVFAQNLEEAPIYCLSSNYVFCEENFKIFNLRVKSENEKKDNSFISPEDVLLQKGEDKQVTNRIINKVIPKKFLNKLILPHHL